MNVSELELFEQIAKALMSSGCDENSFTITESDVLVDDEYIKSVLVDIQFKPYDSDEGEVAPGKACLQFDYNKEFKEYCLIVGEDTETSITYGNLFASMYFMQSPLNPTPATELVEDRFYLENFEGILNVRDRKSILRPMICYSEEEGRNIVRDLNGVVTPASNKGGVFGKLLHELDDDAEMQADIAAETKALQDRQGKVVISRECAERLKEHAKGISGSDPYAMNGALKHQDIRAVEQALKEQE